MPSPNSQPFLLAIVIGIAIVVVGAFVPALGFLELPGLIVAAPIFPQGIHTSSGAGTSWFIALWSGAVLFWSVVAFILVKLIRRIRSRVQGA